MIQLTRNQINIAKDAMGDPTLTEAEIEERITVKLTGDHRYFEATMSLWTGRGDTRTQAICNLFTGMCQ